jgi:hypothetical protein
LETELCFIEVFALQINAVDYLLVRVGSAAQLKNNEKSGWSLKLRISSI